MFPLGVLRKEQVGGGGGGGVGVLRLSLPFATDAIDISGNNIPTRTAQGVPTYSDGSLLLDSTDKIATGSSNLQLQYPLYSAGKGWQLEFDVQMLNTVNTAIFYKAINVALTAAPNLQLEQSTGLLRLRSYTDQDVFTVNVGLDMSAAFFNVKIVQTTNTDYPKLYINDVLIATSTISGDIFGHQDQAGFVFGTGSNGTGFKIKNFKFYIT